MVRATTGHAMKLQKRAYDKHVNFTTYNVGDHVLLYKPLPARIRDYRKFRNTYKGPLVITKCINVQNYIVEDPETGKHEVVHFDALRKVKPGVNLRKTKDSEPGSSHLNTDRAGHPTEDEPLHNSSSEDDDSSEGEEIQEPLDTNVTIGERGTAPLETTGEHLTTRTDIPPLTLRNTGGREGIRDKGGVKSWREPGWRLTGRQPQSNRQILVVGRQDKGEDRNKRGKRREQDSKSWRADMKTNDGSDLDQGRVGVHRDGILRRSKRIIKKPVRYAEMFS